MDPIRCLSIGLANDLTACRLAPAPPHLRPQHECVTVDCVDDNLRDPMTSVRLRPCLLKTGALSATAFHVFCVSRHTSSSRSTMCELLHSGFVCVCGECWCRIEGHIITLDMYQPGKLFDTEAVPVFDTWDVEHDSMNVKIGKLLKNMKTLQEYALERPRSGVARLLARAGFGDYRPFVPRRGHVTLLINAIHSICLLYKFGRSTATDKARLIHGPKGIGKSFVATLIVLGSSLCLPIGGPHRILAGYVSAPMKRPDGKLMTASEMICELHKEHGLVKTAEDESDFMKDWVKWFLDNGIRVVLIMDEFDKTYMRPKEEVSRCIDCFCNRSTSSLTMLWLTGSAGSLRTLVYGRVREDLREYPGYVVGGPYVQKDKCYELELDNRISFYQSLQLLRFATPKTERVGDVATFVDKAEHYLWKHRDEVKRENSREDAEHALLIADEGSPWEISMDSAPPTGTADIDEHEICQTTHGIFWNSCGIARHYETMSQLDQEAETLQELRHAMGQDTTLSRFLRALASVFEMEVPSVMNPFLAFSNDGFQLVPRTRVLGESILTQADREYITSATLVSWSDLNYFYFRCTSRGETWELGFRHPRYAAEAIAVQNAELNGMTAWRRLSILYPVGGLGQGYPETVALRAMANGGLKHAIKNAVYDGEETDEQDSPRNGVGNKRADDYQLPDAMRFTFIPDVELDLRNPREWNPEVVERIRNGDPIIVATTLRQYGVDGVAFWTTATEGGGVHRHVALIQIKLACLVVGQTFQRVEEHGDVAIGKVCDKLHEAWGAWRRGIVEELRWELGTTVPWMVLQTCKDVRHKKQSWARYLAGDAIPENADSYQDSSGQTSEYTLSRQSRSDSGDPAPAGGERVSSNLRSASNPMSRMLLALQQQDSASPDSSMGDEEHESLPFSGFGSVVDQSDLYGFWPAEVTKLAEMLDLAPEYIEHKVQRHGGTSPMFDGAHSSRGSRSSGSVHSSPARSTAGDSDAGVAGTPPKGTAGTPPKGTAGTPPEGTAGTPPKSALGESAPRKRRRGEKTRRNPRERPRPGGKQVFVDGAREGRRGQVGGDNEDDRGVSSPRRKRPRRR